MSGRPDNYQTTGFYSRKCLMSMSQLYKLTCPYVRTSYILDRHEPPAQTCEALLR
jgi:hypothetical protein